MKDLYRRQYDSWICGPNEDETSRAKLIYRRRARKRIKREWKKERSKEDKCQS